MHKGCRVALVAVLIHGVVLMVLIIQRLVAR